MGHVFYEFRGVPTSAEGVAARAKAEGVIVGLRLGPGVGILRLYWHGSDKLGWWGLSFHPTGNVSDGSLQEASTVFEDVQGAFRKFGVPFTVE